MAHGITALFLSEGLENVHGFQNLESLKSLLLCLWVSKLTQKQGLGIPLCPEHPLELLCQDVAQA